ncbi:hypothetical protein [Chondromyces apiculatus]|uniref:Uncharacterized protein n=1 Tax=Chondromyces apiculatus DSM 436 TaxID=1192034 RepID=A0A017T1T6_9BACT|nr:hypothetical protein [Chondromyces apiculatus]EYF03188.1 Hypothetical protein CAP_6164 [Chondromyces apiculatus DSM 436]
MAENDVSTPAATTGKSSGKGKARVTTRTKLIVLAVIALTVVIVVQTGLAGYGFAHLRAATFPGDAGLLEHIPATSSGVLLVDTHRLDPALLGPEGGTVRTYLTRTRDDIKKATGIDLWFDVDKIAFAPPLTVARGRFDGASLAERLKESSYNDAEYRGVKYLIRGGQDALAVLDGTFLLYGDETAIRASIDAGASNATLDDQEAFNDRLDAVGWEYPVLGTLQINADKPSVKEILSGSTGPRAFSFGLDTKGGLSLKALVESVNPASAEELRKLLDGKKADAAALRTLAGPEAGPVLADVAARATLVVPPGSSQVAIQLSFSPEELDRMAKAASSIGSNLGQIYGSMRLFQLLVPSP